MKKSTTGNCLSKCLNLTFKTFLLACTFTLTKFEAFSQSSVNFVIDPVNVEVDDVFTVDVKVDFGTGSLSLVETYINFNPLDLQVQAIPVVSATTNAELPNTSVPINSVANMNSTGNINYGRFTLDPDPANHPDADFVFISITFKALRVPPGGTTSISFNSAIPRVSIASETTTSDALEDALPGIVTISAAGCTPPTAVISAPTGTTTCNSQPFNLTLSSASGTGPFDVTIEGPNGTATFDNIAVGGVITTFTPPVQSIWPATPPAPFPATSDDNPYTLGVKFTSSVAGFVKGVRFFSAGDVSAIAGNYTGQLWDEFGTLLASGTFTGVTVDSWQELIFDDPILITPGTVYVASYNTGVSTNYASTANGLASNVISGPLTALANGLFHQGAAVAFPGVPGPPDFLGGTTPSNYWVDVVFSPNEYTFNLTSVKDAGECINTGALQTLSISSVDCATLPVSLLNLSATPKDNSIVLTWSTASEINNKGFEVQRRTESGNWVALSFVTGAGNSNSTHNYNYRDEKLSSGKYYYRLKQVDIDGRYEFSPVVSAVIGGSQKFSLEQNYPNPFRGETIVRFTLPEKANIKLSVFDMHGRLVKTLVSGAKEKGTHAITLNSSTLTSGLYYYKLETENFSAVKKMTIQ